MLPMNSPLVNAVATQIMARACAVQGIRIVSTVQVLRENVLWMAMNSPCAATQGSIWDGVTNKNLTMILTNLSDSDSEREFNHPLLLCVHAVRTNSSSFGPGSINSNIWPLLLSALPRG